MSEKNKAMIAAVTLAFEEIWNRKNLAYVDVACTPDFVLHSPAAPHPIRGREAFKQYSAKFFQAFPDMHITIEEIIAQGDTVASRWTIRGTHQGDLTGIPPTGRQITMPGATLYHLTDDQVNELWINQDLFGLMRQIGLIPDPKAGLRGLIRSISLGMRVARRQAKLGKAGERAG